MWRDSIIINRKMRENIRLGRMRKVLGRRGDAGTLVMIIIAIISFLILSAVMAKFLVSADDKTAENLCQSSIAARAATAVRIGSEESWFVSSELKRMPALCKTIDRKVKGSREEIKKQIAGKIARCWWQFGEGRYEEILKTADISPVPMIYGTGSLKNQCFVCYVMIIDQGEIQPDDNADCRTSPDNCPISALEFVDYLDSTPYKTKYDSCKGEECISCESDEECSDGSSCQNKKCVPADILSYLGYIQKYGGPGQVGFLTDALRADNAYAITFLPKNRPVGGSYWSRAEAAICGEVGSDLSVVDRLACSATLPSFVIGAATDFVFSVAGGSAIGIEGRSDVVDSDRMTQIFSEREFSSIYISDLTTALKYCPSEDMAGK